MRKRCATSTSLSSPRPAAPRGKTQVKTSGVGFGCSGMYVSLDGIQCNEQPSRATSNTVSGKACSSTKGGLLRYIPNTYSIHLVSSLKFAYFQGRLSRYITSPSEKARPESWPGYYMGKATPVWRLSSSRRCHQM